MKKDKDCEVLNGREASVLALIAQCNGTDPDLRNRVLPTLDGVALRIAKCMFGEKGSKKDKDVADAFIAWAQELPVARE